VENNSKAIFMRKKTIGVGVGVLFLAGVFFVFWISSKEAPRTNWEEAIMYFYGKQCSHCQNVYRFLEENQIGEKVNYQKIEVWESLGSQKLFNEAIRRCKIDTSSGGVGVPLLYARGKCFSGETEVVDFFRREIGVK
jgi:hypothetical protein